jgi:hypothetical protein
MISFFRKIRQTLLAKNKFGRYLIYALGEIILVVIGILIALQINNWNELKKARVYELKILNEIRGALIQDIKYSEYILEERIKSIDDESQALLKIIQQENIDTEIFNNHFKRMYSGFVFQYNNGAYEALKASGIEKISNDGLRNRLVEFYEFDIPRTDKLLLYSNGMDIMGLQKDLLWQLFDYEVGQNLYDKNKLGMRISKYKSDDFKDVRLLKLINLKVKQASNGKARINNFIKDSQELLKLINQELPDAGN